ncbi:MAG: hypothetical protein ACREEL_07420 [Stellaceae bacterium]
MKSKDIEMVLREVRRMRGEARALPRGEVRKTLETAADKLEKLARRLEAEAAPSKRMN